MVTVVTVDAECRCRDGLAGGLCPWHVAVGSPA